MGDNRSPEDILDEIMNRTTDSAPTSSAGPPRFDPPPPEDIPPAPDRPEETAAADRAGKLLPWLCLVLGFALLVLGLCVLQVTKVNGRLDELRQTVEAMQIVDDLREENKQLQKDLEGARNEAAQASDLNEQYQQMLGDILTERNSYVGQVQP